MQNLNYFISKAKDIEVNVKGEMRVLISKEELISFITDVYGKQFVNRSQAKKLTNLSYLGSVNSSAKIVKGLKKNYNTFILYLQPHKTIFGVIIYHTDCLH